MSSRDLTHDSQTEDSTPSRRKLLESKFREKNASPRREPVEKDKE